MQDTDLALAPIAVVERETGIGKDTLRVWERRYGFPQPLRDEHGERVYPADQIARLRLMRRLMVAGHRPSRLVGASEAQLQTMIAALPEATHAEPAPDELHEIVRLLRQHDPERLRSALAQRLSRQGLEHFATGCVPLLNRLVGEAWSRGELEVFEEHLYTEQMQALLRQAIGALPPGRANPRILLTTVPDEQHVLGLLMLEALLSLDGASCVSLGTQTPLADIAAAARAHLADIVILSFSAAFPARQVPALALRLRETLPAEVELWIGGNGAQRLPAIAGVLASDRLPAAQDFLADWRRRRGHWAGH